MHSFVHRLNAVFCYALVVAAFVVTGLALSSLFHQSSPQTSVRLSKVHRLMKIPALASDQALVTFDLDAKLSSEFHWNVKELFVYITAEYETDLNSKNQIVLWDKIIQSKEEADFTLEHAAVEYPLRDQGHGLRGRKVNLTVSWNVIPVAGSLFTVTSAPHTVELPDKYI
eukprot:TRINITY_DN2289_c0_g1_i1.p1 TRINITY_DN2289_c0_g1~~TRINITY_DN2289_c0_g1_i1.p1  ORF type:complete len:170 (+),score=16.27 TRINITY_DN2289_c0_g1_i1:21-530(+)